MGDPPRIAYEAAGRVGDARAGRGRAGRPQSAHPAARSHHTTLTLHSAPSVAGDLEGGTARTNGIGTTQPRTVTSTHDNDDTDGGGRSDDALMMIDRPTSDPLTPRDGRPRRPVSAAPRGSPPSGHASPMYRKAFDHYGARARPRSAVGRAAGGGSDEMGHANRDDRPSSPAPRPTTATRVHRPSRWSARASPLRPRSAPPRRPPPPAESAAAVAARAEARTLYRNNPGRLVRAGGAGAPNLMGSLKRTLHAASPFGGGPARLNDACVEDILFGDPEDRTREARARELHRYQKELDAAAAAEEQRRRRAAAVHAKATRWKSEREAREAASAAARAEARDAAALRAEWRERSLRRELRERSAAALEAKRSAEAAAREAEEAAAQEREYRRRPAEEPMDDIIYARLCRHASNNGKQQKEDVNGNGNGAWGSAGAGVPPSKPRPISATNYDRLTRGWDHVPFHHNSQEAANRRAASILAKPGATRLERAEAASRLARLDHGARTGIAPAAMLPRALAWLEETTSLSFSVSGEEAGDEPDDEGTVVVRRHAAAADALSLVAALAGADPTAKKLALSGEAVIAALRIMRATAEPGSSGGSASGGFVHAAAKRLLCVVAGCTSKEANAVENVVRLFATVPSESDGGAPAEDGLWEETYEPYAKDVSVVAGMLANPAGEGVTKVVPSQEVAAQLVALAPVHRRVLLQWGLAGGAKNVSTLLDPFHRPPLRMSKALNKTWTTLRAATIAHVSATVEVHPDVAAAGLVVNVRCDHPRVPFNASLPVTLSRGIEGVQDATVRVPLGTLIIDALVARLKELPLRVAVKPAVWVTGGAGQGSGDSGSLRLTGTREETHTVRLSTAIAAWHVGVGGGDGLGHEIVTQRLVATAARFLSVRCYDARTGRPPRGGASVVVASVADGSTVGTLQTDPDSGVATVLSTASADIAKAFLAGALSIEASSPDPALRFTSAVVDLTDPEEDGTTIDMPGVILYRVHAKVCEDTTGTPLTHREVHLRCDGPGGEGSTTLATGTTDGKGTVILESTDASWGKADGLRVEVVATETHRGGQVSVTLTAASPQVIPEVIRSAKKPPPKRVIVRWLDAATGEPIAGGDAQIYAAPPSPDGAPDGTDGAGTDGPEDDETVGYTARAVSSGGPGGTGGALEAPIVSATEDAAAAGVALDGSPYEIVRPFDAMPARVIVRVLAPRTVSPDDESAGGELAGVYTEVTEELCFDGEGDHTKYVTAHLVRMTPGEEDRVWVVVTSGGVGAGSGRGGNQGRRLSDVRLMCPTGEEVNAESPAARYAEARVLSGGKTGEGEHDDEPTLPAPPAAVWALSATLTNDRGADAWWRLLVDCGAGSPGGSVEGSGAVVRIYKTGGDAADVAKPVHVARSDRCVGAGGWWDVAVWSDEEGMVVPISEARVNPPTDRMNTVIERVNAFKEASNNA